MASSVRDTGLPVVRAHTTLDAIVEMMKEHGTNDHNAFRLPVAYFLLGELELAREYVYRELEGMHDITIPYNVLYQKFASSLLERLKG